MASNWSTSPSNLTDSASNLSTREYAERRFRGGISPAAVARELEAQYDDSPSRATVYNWRAAWLKHRGDPTRWRLTTDRTGRPDIVLAVLAAIHAESGGHIESLSEDEAAMVVRLASLPGLLEDATFYSVSGLGIPPDVQAAKGVGIEIDPSNQHLAGQLPLGEPIRIETWPVRLFNWAIRILSAPEAEQPEQELLVALLYADGGRHFATLMKKESES